MVEKASKLRPAMIGGLIFGLLVSIPFVNLGNLCCCAWVLLGGAIAARSLIKQSPVLPISSGDGAAVGALAGLIGSGVYLVLGVPLGLLIGESLTVPLLRQLAEISNNPTIQQMVRQAIEQAQTQTFSERLAPALLNWVIMSVIYIGFATLGGVIGVALFEKRKGQPAPPPPAGQPPSFIPPPTPPPGNAQPPY